jgi:prepilin signal peptidase PulO-like enzyme (type II secretory pathway)
VSIGGVDLFAQAAGSPHYRGKTGHRRKGLMADATYAVLAFVMGASIGSFLNVVADRFPSGRSVVRPASFCESCHRHLSAADTVPVLSYLWLRGRCRYCGAKFPARLAVVEAVNGALMALLYWRYGLGGDLFVYGAAVSLLVVISVIDLDHGLIFDRMVFPAVGLLLVLSPFWGEIGPAREFFGTFGLLGSFASSTVAGASYFVVLYLIVLVYPKGMGAGDVKFAALI